MVNNSLLKSLGELIFDKEVIRPVITLKTYSGDDLINVGTDYIESLNAENIVKYKLNKRFMSLSLATIFLASSGVFLSKSIEKIVSESTYLSDYKNIVYDNRKMISPDSIRLEDGYYFEYDNIAISLSESNDFDMSLYGIYVAMNGNIDYVDEVLFRYFELSGEKAICKNFSEYLSINGFTSTEGFDLNKYVRYMNSCIKIELSNIKKATK